MNNLLKTMLFDNRYTVVYCSIITILATLVIILPEQTGGVDPLFFNFSAICSIIITSSITFLTFSNNIKTGWYSFLISYKNERNWILGSSLLVVHLNILVCSGIMLLLISLYDSNIIDTILPTIVTIALLSSLVSSGALTVFASTGKDFGFNLAVPAMAILGCILTYISIVHPAGDFPNMVLFGILALISIVNIALSFVMIKKTDL